MKTVPCQRADLAGWKSQEELHRQCPGYAYQSADGEKFICDCECGHPHLGAGVIDYMREQANVEND